MSIIVRRKHELSEELGNLRAGAVMIGVSVSVFALGVVLLEYLVGFLLLPLAVMCAVFGVALTLHHGRVSWKLLRELRAMRQLPAACIIPRPDTSGRTVRGLRPIAR